MVTRMTPEEYEKKYGVTPTSVTSYGAPRMTQEEYNKKYSKTTSAIPAVTPMREGKTGLSGFFTGLGQSGWNTYRGLNRLVTGALDVTVGRGVNALVGKGFTPTDTLKRQQESPTSPFGTKFGEYIQPQTKAEAAGRLTGDLAQYLYPATRMFGATATLPLATQVGLRTLPDVAISAMQSAGGDMGAGDVAKNVGVVTAASAVGNRLFPGAGAFGRLSSLGRGAATGYVADVGAGLTGARGETYQGPGAFIPSYGTLAGAGLGALGGSGSGATRAQRAIDDLEDTLYKIAGERAPTRKKLAQTTLATQRKNAAGTVGVTPQRKLAEAGIVPEIQGTNFHTQAQADQLLNEVGALREANRAGLLEAGRATPPLNLADLEAESIRLARSPQNIASGKANTMVRAIRKAFAEYRANYGNTISLLDADDIKAARWKETWRKLTAEDALLSDVNYKIGKAMQQSIEKTALNAGLKDVAQLNREMGDLLEAVNFLKSIDGKPVLYGKMGTHMLRLGGAIAGAQHGILGSVGGMLGGEYIAAMLRSASVATPVKRMILAQVRREAAQKGPQALADVNAWVAQQGLDRATRLALPAPRYTPMPAPKDISGVQVVPAKATFGRDVKSGQYKKAYTSEPAVDPTGVPIQSKGSLPSKKNEPITQTKTPTIKASIPVTKASSAPTNKVVINIKSTQPTKVKTKTDVIPEQVDEARSIEQVLSSRVIPARTRVGTTGRYIGSPGIHSPQKLTALVKRLKGLAEKGATGAQWYRKSADEIVREFGKEDAIKFLKLIAVYSNKTTPAQNYERALRAFLQYKAGQPIRGGAMSFMDRKAEAILRQGADWEGIKTNSFYQNMLKYVDPENADVNAVTNDLWMMRAFGYGKKESGMSDQQHVFMTRIIQKIAKETGQSPDEVQAAIWVAMRSGESKTVKNIAEDAEGFAGVARKLFTGVSWEAAPSKSSGLFPEMFSAPWEQRMEYHARIERRFFDDNGNNIILDLVGLPQGKTLRAPGVWEGQVSPGTQFLVGVPRQTGNPYKIDPTAYKKLQLASALMGKLTNQDGVGFGTMYVAKRLKDADAGVINIGRVLTEQESIALDKAMTKHFGAGSYAIVGEPRGARIIHFTDFTPDKFRASLKEAVNDAWSGTSITDANIQWGVKDGELVASKPHDYGANYRELIEGWRPGSRERVLLQSIEDGIESDIRHFSRKYGWTDGRKPGNEWDYPIGGGDKGVTEKLTESVMPKKKVTTVEVTQSVLPKAKTRSLESEAKKYKTPEEFIEKAGSIPIQYNWSYLDDLRADKQAGRSYSHSDLSALEKLEKLHRFSGTSETFYRTGRINKKGDIYLTPDEWGAETYATDGVSRTREFKVLTKKPLVLKTMEDVEGIIGKQKDGFAPFTNSPTLKQKVIDYAKSNGYDSVMFPDSTANGLGGIDSLVVWDNNIIKTPSQLKELWKKANSEQVDNMVDHIGFGISEKSDVAKSYTSEQLAKKLNYKSEVAVRNNNTEVLVYGNPVKLNHLEKRLFDEHGLTIVKDYEYTYYRNRSTGEITKKKKSRQNSLGQFSKAHPVDGNPYIRLTATNARNIVPEEKTVASAFQTTFHEFGHGVHRLLIGDKHINRFNTVVKQETKNLAYERFLRAMKPTIDKFKLKPEHVKMLYEDKNVYLRDISPEFANDGGWVPGQGHKVSYFSNPSEIFAESYAMYRTNPEYLQMQSPDMFKFIDDLVNEL